jgi:hypothetical protein
MALLYVLLAFVLLLLLLSQRAEDVRAVSPLLVILAVRQLKYRYD